MYQLKKVVIEKGFFNGMKTTGIGSFILPNQDIYHGNLKYSKMDGIGVYYKKTLNNYSYGMFK